MSIKDPYLRELQARLENHEEFKVAMSRRLYERSTDAAIVSQVEIDMMYANGKLQLDGESPLRGDVVSGTIHDGEGNHEHVVYRFIRKEG